MRNHLIKWLLVPALLFSNIAWGSDLEQGMHALERGDHETAIEILTPLAEQGDALAQFFLAMMYAEGKGVPADEEMMAKWLRRAVEQGEIKELLRLFAAEVGQESAELLFGVGVMYAEGIGGPTVYKEAVKWYRLAAEQGHAEAQGRLGVMYAKGEGVPVDDKEAVKWYRLAAEQGLALAQAKLGLMYADGLGVPANDKEAVTWYRLAAEQGLVEAQALLGLVYFQGKGIPQDYVSAHMWLNIAGANGEEKARKSREITERFMTPEQIAEAQQRAADCERKEYKGC